VRRPSVARRLRIRGSGKAHCVREILIVSAFLSLAGALAYIGLLLWAAREDGRDQARRDWLRGR
jgi:hypothetical protein